MSAQTAGAKTRGGAEFKCAVFAHFLTQKTTPLSKASPFPCHIFFRQKGRYLKMRSRNSERGRLSNFAQKVQLHTRTEEREGEGKRLSTK